MNEWISVEDRLPDSEYTVVLGCQSRNSIMGVGRFKDGVFRKGSGAMDYISEVTHWMPLPEPPK